MTDPIADALLRHYLTPPPAPAPPKPTWEPSEESVRVLDNWLACDWTPRKQFLRRLYAQLHRDRVAALGPEQLARFGVVSTAQDAPDLPDWACADITIGAEPAREALLALADDGNGA